MNQPATITTEKPAGNLASLALTSPLKHLFNTVIRQRAALAQFKALAKFGIYPTRQVLFYGPPGNGKTFACQWIANKLSLPLFRVRCEALVDSLLGATAKNVAEAMEWLAKNGDSVVLLDEIESIFMARSDGGGSCAHAYHSAMAVFWQYLDRWTGNHLFVAATNMPDKIDKALLSRFEIKLEFGPPAEDQVRSVISYWSEALHQFGGDAWGKSLIELVEGGHEFVSFRELWQTIQRAVIEHVTTEN